MSKRREKILKILREFDHTEAGEDPNLDLAYAIDAVYSEEENSIIHALDHLRRIRLPAAIVKANSTVTKASNHIRKAMYELERIQFSASEEDAVIGEHDEAAVDRC